MKPMGFDKRNDSGLLGALARVWVAYRVRSIVSALHKINTAAK